MRLSKFFISGHGFSYLLDESGECLGSIDSHVSQDLAVKLDVESLQAVDETAIAQTVLLGGGLDPDDPEAPEIPLPVAPVAVGVEKGLLHGFLGCPVIVALRSPVALGQLQILGPAGPSLGTSFDSRHLELLPFI